MQLAADHVYALDGMSVPACTGGYYCWQSLHRVKAVSEIQEKLDCGSGTGGKMAAP